MLIVNGKEITHETKKYVRDEDCHWFVIHKDDEAEFRELLGKCAEEDYVGEKMDEFDAKFGNGMTGGAMDLRDSEIGN